MLLLVGIQVFIIALFFLLGWGVRSKKAYWLISGFSNRPKEEQQQLIDNRYPQKTGALLMAVAVGMAVLIPLYFMEITYAIEIQFGFMLFTLLGGLIYLSKYEVQKKRKRSYIISSLLFIVVNSLVIVVFFIGYQEYELISKENSFEITGVYGDEWKNNEITRIELLEEMPEVTWKQNGFGLATLAKGYFKVKGYGSSLLFIYKDSSPYLYIETKDQKIFINGKTPDQTQEWYKKLKKAQNPYGLRTTLPL